MTILKQAKAIRSAMDKLAENATDAVASMTAIAFPQLKEDGGLIRSGTRINWKGVIKKAAVDLWDAAENNPDNAPALWEDIQYKEGYRIIPEVITVDLVFAKDECGWWNDKLYKSLIDANTYTPEQYAAGWEIVN